MCREVRQDTVVLTCQDAEKSASGVLASLRGSTYRSVRLASSLAAALLGSLFEHPGISTERNFRPYPGPKPSRKSILAAHVGWSMSGLRFPCRSKIAWLRCRS